MAVLAITHSLLMAALALLPLAVSFAWQPSLVRFATSLPSLSFPTTQHSHWPSGQQHSESPTGYGAAHASDNPVDNSPDILLVSSSDGARQDFDSHTNLAVAKALGILGYVFVPFAAYNGSEARLGMKKTFTVLAGEENEEVDSVLERWPEMRVIRDTNSGPQGQKCGRSWLGREIGCKRNYQSSSSSSPAPLTERTLEMNTQGKEAISNARWGILLAFLGEGYSITERLGLRDFPKEGVQNTWGGWGAGWRSLTSASHV